MYRIVPVGSFLKDVERMEKRGYNFSDAEGIIDHLRDHGRAPATARPHKLKGEWRGHWECHIGFDRLLIYIITDDTIVLRRTGTHDDLFG